MTGAIIAGLASVIVATITTWGVLRSARRQSQPNVIQATQQVLTETIKVLTNELARIRQEHVVERGEFLIEVRRIRNDRDAVIKERDELAETLRKRDARITYLMSLVEEDHDWSAFGMDDDDTLNA